MNREDIIHMAREAGLMGNPLAYADWYPKSLEHFAALVAAAEREACAKLVEESPSYDWHRFACEAAAAIRARGETK